jgi:hypothetical protein
LKLFHIVNRLFAWIERTPLPLEAEHHHREAHALATGSTLKSAVLLAA